MLGQQRRPEGVSVHDWHHILIDKRFTEWQKAPRSIQRRDNAKRAWWTMIGHLRAYHGINFGRQSISLDWAKAHAMHVQSHQQEDQ